MEDRDEEGLPERADERDEDGLLERVEERDEEPEDRMRLEEVLPLELLMPERLRSPDREDETPLERPPGRPRSVRLRER